MTFLIDIKLNTDNITNHSYLENIGKSLINLINKSYERNKIIYCFDQYLRQNIFRYLNIRYHGFMDNSYANYIIFSIEELKNIYPNIFEILVDPVLILKKYLFENFLAYCRKSCSSENNIWTARINFKKNLPITYYYRTIGLNCLIDFPKNLNPAALRNNGSIQIPDFDIAKYLEEFSKFNNNYFLKDNEIIKKIDEIFSDNKITTPKYKNDKFNEILLNDTNKKHLDEIFNSYYSTIRKVTAEDSYLMEAIYKYLMPISLLARFRVSPSENQFEALLSLSGIQSSKNVDKFRTYFFTPIPKGKPELGVWVRNFISKYKCDSNEIRKFAPMNVLKKFDPLLSISKYRQVSLSVATNPAQSGDTYKFFKVYTLALTELDHFKELEAKKHILVSQSSIDNNIPISDELNHKFTYEKLRDSLEDFVFGPIGNDMIANSDLVKYEEIADEKKYDLYYHVEKSKNAILETNYLSLTEKGGALKKTPMEIANDNFKKR